MYNNPSHINTILCIIIIIFVGTNWTKTFRNIFVVLWFVHAANFEFFLEEQVSMPVLEGSDTWWGLFASTVRVRVCVCDVALWIQSHHET